MSGQVQLLDCTLRDGAYIVDAAFGTPAMKGIIRKMQESNVDIIECGWLKDKRHTVGTTFYHTPSDLEQYMAEKNSKTIYVAMIDWDRYDLRSLPEYDGKSIDAIRVVFPQNRFREGIGLGRMIKKNSGGEGFLSAFVILSALLYYMRKDDSDIFADRNEGKVLIMDNPFAQTNASHLLKPLMDVAEKTNTQMICLTGLGGESIYNRFDNIYVLNLVASNLRGGMQYLRGEHLRGAEEETIVSSQIEVIGQQRLEF